MTTDKPDLPAQLSAEYLASLAVENGEGGAQLMIDDQLLHQSLVANVRKQMQRLEVWARTDERRKALESAARLVDAAPSAQEASEDIRALLDRKEPTT